MKKTKISLLTLLAILGLSFNSWAVDPVSTARFYQGVPNTPPTPTLTVIGTTGGNTLSYSIVCHHSTGNISAPSNPAVVSNASAVLSSINKINIAWVNTCPSVDVLKNGIYSALALGVTTGSVQDTGQALIPYTPVASPLTGALNLQGPTNLLGPYATLPATKTLVATDYIDVSVASLQQGLLTTNTALTLINLSNGQHLTLDAIQDASGSHTLTVAVPANFNLIWVGGSTPSISSGANTYSTLNFHVVGTTVIGSLVGSGSGGGSTSPGGSSGQVQYNNTGAFGGFTVGGDGTLNTGTGALTVTKTNGSAFVASATTDTTVATNITSGTLPAGQLPTVPLNKGGLNTTTAPTSAQLPLGNAGGTAYAPQSLSQDCTVSNTGVMTCLKTNNVSFGTSATVNTGTSGATIPLNNGNNTFGGTDTFSNPPTMSGANISATTVPVGSVNATGSASSSTYLRGDGSWSTPSGSASAAFYPHTISAGTTGTMTVQSSTLAYGDTDYFAPTGNATVTTPAAAAMADTNLVKLVVTESGAARTITFSAGAGITLKTLVLGDSASTAGQVCAPPITGTLWFLFQYSATPGTFTLLSCGSDPPPATLGVALGGTGIASGTSGGVLAFTASGTLASSSALTANLPVIGGGAGVAPSSGTRSGNTTSFATTTGSLTNTHLATWDASGNLVDGGAPSSGNNGPCTDFWTAGAQSPTWTAGHTYCPSATGTYTFAAAQAVNVANVKILCGNKNMVLQRTGTTDLFDVTANGFDIEGCDIDGNSQTSAGTGPLINLNNSNDSIVQNNIFTNAGKTAATQTGTVWVQRGLRTRIINNSWTTSQTDTAIWINSQSNAFTVSDLIISGNYIPTFAPASNLYAIAVNQSGGSNISTHIKVDDNVIIGTTAHGTGIGWLGTVSIQSSRLFGGDISRNQVYATAAMDRLIHIFGCDSCTINGNILQDGGNTIGGALLDLGDVYDTTISGNSIYQTASFGNTGMTLADGTGDTLANNTIDGVTNGPTGQGIFITSISNPISDNTVSGNLIRCAGACNGIQLTATNANALSRNTITGNTITGGASSSSFGIQMTDTSGTMDANTIESNTITAFSGTSNICISIGSGPTHTYIGHNNLQGCTTSMADSGTSSTDDTWDGVTTGTLSGGTLTKTFPVPCIGVVGVCQDTTTQGNKATIAFTSSTSTTCTATITGTGTDVFICTAQLH